MSNDQKILIVAGEPSGDLHGANLAMALHILAPDLALYGVGGEKMASSGIKLYFNIVSLAGIGVSEVFNNLARLHKVFQKLISIIKSNNFKGIILIDFPEFNLRLARAIAKFKIPVIYYISPQVWAWRRGRVKTISRYIRKMLVVLPFEKEFYQKSGIPVEFTGHPLLDTIRHFEDKEAIKDMLEIPKDKIVVGLLPGSRISEFKKNFPVMLETAKIIAKNINNVDFILPLSSSIPRDIISSMVKPEEEKLIRVISGRSHEVMDVAALILVASGTATLEAACHFCPMIIIYKISFLTWLFVRPLIKVPYVGLVNLIANKKIVPEYLQFQARPAEIAREALSLLKNEDKRKEVIDNLVLVRELLGNPGASAKAARIILDTI